MLGMIYNKGFSNDILVKKAKKSIKNGLIVLRHNKGIWNIMEDLFIFYGEVLER